MSQHIKALDEKYKLEEAQRSGLKRSPSRTASDEELSPEIHGTKQDMKNNVADGENMNVKTLIVMNHDQTVRVEEPPEADVQEISSDTRYPVSEVVSTTTKT